MIGRPISRNFERTLRGPFQFLREEAGGSLRPGAAVKEDDAARKFLYETLMQVSFRHRYYNTSGFACPDFTVFPTPASAALMASLGILFKATPTGFSVLYDSKSRKRLADYLRRQGEEWEKGHPEKPEKQVWTRLTFVMSLRNPYFVNLTDIPIDTNLSAGNFYFTNQDAHQEKDRLLLNRGSHVTAEQLLPVVGVQVAVPVAADVTKVVFRDISGEEALCKPRCVPCWVAKLKRADMITCADLKIPRPPGEKCEGDRCTDVLYFDLTPLPEDRYTVEETGLLPVVKESDVLYTFSQDASCGLIDLLFTSPNGKRRKAYPVRGLFQRKTKVVPRHYILELWNRETLWNYYIVPPQDKSFIDLCIEGGKEDGPRVPFKGPEEMVLANGARAYRFVSLVPIPLQERSEYHFTLEGRQAALPHQKVRVDRLPVASSRQVIPQPPDDQSDVFVYV